MLVQLFDANRLHFLLMFHKQRILSAPTEKNFFQNVRSEFENSLYYCLKNNGEHFEHLL